MGLGIGRKLKKEARRVEKKLKGGFEDITGAKDLKKARAAEKQARSIERRAAMFEFERDKRRMLEEGRISRASLVAQAVSEGLGKSSSLSGAIASQGTQQAERVATAQEEMGFGLAGATFQSRANDRRSRAQEKSSTTSAVLNIGGALAGL